MKLNSTIGLTLILLASMLIAGIMSAVAGMSLGREALKGITQPDTRPTNNLANRKGDAPRKNEVLILQEDKIVATVKARMSGKVATAAPKAVAVKTTEEKTQTKLPIVGESKGVSLEVKAIQQQGDALALQVSLRNGASNSVKFLYTFLEVRDDQGRVLTANTEGLPSEVPPDGELYSGTIRVPVTAVDKVKTLSLALADYPDQLVNLKLSNIPVNP